MQKLLTTREVAAFLRLREETVLRKVKKGEIPALRIGGRLRFPQDLLEEWLREMTAARPSDVVDKARPARAEEADRV